MLPPTRICLPRCKQLICSLIVVTVTALIPSITSVAAQKAADLVEDGQRINLAQPKYQALFTELEQKYHFHPQELQNLFKGVAIKKRVLVLMDKQWEAQPYHKYLPLFKTKTTVKKGRDKLVQHRELLDKIEKVFEVDRETVVAIWGIETRYGVYQGSFDVFRTLNTLFDAYPRRAAFFRDQLIHFLVLCRENKISPHGVQGSYAGAFGQTQFIPSSFQSYAVSFDGDDKRDVWHSVPDILASIANYLKHFGWVLDAPVYAELGPELHDRRLLAAKLQGRKGRVAPQVVSEAQQRVIPPSPQNKALSIIGLELAPEMSHSMRYVAGYPNFQAITQWNHSNRYAMAVTELAEAMASR